MPPATIEKKIKFSHSKKTVYDSYELQRVNVKQKPFRQI